MFEQFTLRHIFPLLLATQVTFGGMMPFTHGPEAALLKFGFPPSIAASKGAWPVIKIGSARVTTIGLAIWGMYLGGHFEAIDILIACTGWVALIDGLVCHQEGAAGSTLFRVGLTSVISLWGFLGMTTGKYF
ncbi:hypothetical protein CC86DRAFT_375308 [Ophiobolus disseminans]|uniref:Integral membrane protein n=1 Tax=Ophiobolus disseminans TaxID=1469910 RepID=A0A6A6ZFS9_9PLEO|nr:hypothetical protein CC86DRAFT_375308 [Ophiobolus disseminans]